MSMTPWEVVEAINRAWTVGQAEETARWFHPAAVTVGPRGERIAEGRAACVAGYVDFAAQAALTGFEVGDHQVDIVADTAVVSYAYHIVYQTGNEAHDEAGVDIVVLIRDGTGWLAIWRMVGESV